MADQPDALERIEVRYATFRDSPGGARTDLSTRLRDIGAAERVMVDTCHRVELVTVDARPDAPPQLRGAEAVRRVFEVVAGFDSAVVAEEQLLGQVRGAYEAALAGGESGPILNELFRRALRFGRRVRSHARPGTDRSLADPAVTWIRERVGPHDRVVVAGTGEMGRIVAQRLAADGRPITVVSGSSDRGGRLLETLRRSSRHHLVVGGMSRELLAATAAVAIAVRGRTPMLTAAHLTDATPPWVLDLSSPAAVAPDASGRLGDRLLDLDRLGDLHGGAPVLAPEVEDRLRRSLDDEVRRFVGWLETRRGADALALLHGEADAVRRRHLDRLRRRAGLDDDQLAAVEAASAAMLGELLHGPTVELRRGGADAATIRRLFGIEA